MNGRLVKSIWVWRSLAFKQVATLLFTGLFGVSLVWFLANRATNVGFDQLKLDQAQASFEATAEQYYQAHGSWAGFKEALYSVPMPPQTDGAMSPKFILADDSNHMVICFPPYQTGDLLTNDQLAHSSTISYNGKKIGAVVFAMGSPTLDPRDQQYLAQINQSLLIGAIGAAAIALLIGILITRDFMRPLRDLTVALRAMRHGNLEQEVPIRNKDELGELAQAFNQMSKDLAYANYLRRQMTADIAHDLRTPLTVIGGYLEALQDGTLKPTPQRFETMFGEVTRLKRLVEDLRILSLADSGELKLTRESVPVGTLLKYVADSFQPLCDEKQLRIEVQAEAGIPDLYVDQTRMAQVLGNLVSNAMRHTASGGKVILQAFSIQSEIHISVRDTGTGIPTDKLPYIFERLYRVDESRSGESGESGLGLAIVKSIVEAHDGTVSAQSEVGKGTTITIQFPQKPLPLQKMA